MIVINVNSIIRRTSFAWSKFCWNTETDRWIEDRATWAWLIEKLFIRPWFFNCMNEIEYLPSGKTRLRCKNNSYWNTLLELRKSHLGKDRRIPKSICQSISCQRIKCSLRNRYAFLCKILLAVILQGDFLWNFNKVINLLPSNFGDRVSLQQKQRVPNRL